MLTTPQLQSIRQTLSQFHVLLSELIVALLTEKSYAESIFVEDLTANLGLILGALAQNTRTADPLRKWAHDTMKRHYHRLARDLADKDNGWHLGVVHMKADQVLDFRIEDMAACICQLALELWELVLFVLSGNEIWVQPQTEDVALSAEEVKLWEELGDVDPAVSESGVVVIQAGCNV